MPELCNKVRLETHPRNSRVQQDRLRSQENTDDKANIPYPSYRADRVEFRNATFAAEDTAVLEQVIFFNYDGGSCMCTYTDARNYHSCGMRTKVTCNQFTFFNHDQGFDQPAFGS